MTVAVETTSSPYSHDVFVSYSHKDLDWVSGILVMKLREGGVRVLLDENDFEIGRSSIENMTNAVKQSRRTLVVLTPEWVSSDWTQFEALITTQLDPSGRDRRLIPIMRKPCKPPDWVGYRSYLDFVDDARVEQQIARLIRALKDSQAPVEVVKADAVNHGLRTLADLLKEGPVREALLNFRVRFETISDRIERLADYKYVHDQLHQLQFHVFEAIQRDLPRMGTDDTADDALDFYAQTFQRILSQLRQLGMKNTFARTPLSWIDALDRSYKQLSDGLKAPDPAVVKRAAGGMDRVLAIYPAQIDTQLSSAANELELAELIAAVSTASDRARASGMDPTRLQTLEDALTAMIDLDENLDALVRDHHRWQTADVELRRVDSGLATDSGELIDTWPDLKKLAEATKSEEEWAKTLREEAQRVDAAIAENDERLMARHFRRYRRQASNRFFEIDSTLKLQCDELREAGEPLAAIVETLA